MVLLNVLCPTAWALLNEIMKVSNKKTKDKYTW